MSTVSMKPSPCSMSSTQSCIQNMIRQSSLGANTQSKDQYIKLCSLRHGETTSSQIQNLLNEDGKAPVSKSPAKVGCLVVVW